jgi:hypothetical protein
MEPTTTLGLSSNTRTVGLAIIKGNLLVDYHIRLRKEPWTPHKRERILASLSPWCTSYNIHCVALSIPAEKQLSRQTQELLEAVKDFFTEKKIRVYSYSSKTVYDYFGGAKRRKEMMGKLVLLYPELIYDYQKEMRNKNKYYVKLFEAVGVATLHHQRLKGKQSLGKRTGL